MRRNLGFGMFAAALFTSAALAPVTLAADSDFRVLKSEAIGIRAADLPAAAAQAPVRLQFQAYGESFELLLTSNERLLANLPASQKASLGKHALYRGAISGRPASWVRLTRIGDELHGAFYDGAHLYTIAPASDVAPFSLQSLDASGGEPVVYRLEDTQSVLNTAFCATGAGHAQRASSEPTPQKAYDALVGELQAVAAAIAAEQIEIAFIADFEFSTRFS